MASRATWTVGIMAAQAMALVATAFYADLGTAWWHHVVSLVFVLGLGVLVRDRLGSRAFLGIGVLVTTVLATVSGFVLLYWKEGIRVAGIQDWGVWWHVAWSWAAAAFFWQHTWVNRVTFMHFFARGMGRLGPVMLHTGSYVAGIAAFVVTAGPGKAWFTNENYIPLSVWTWLVVTAAAYILWGIVRRSANMQKRVRGGVDLALVPVAVVAVVSGIPLLFFDPWLDEVGLKYASKYWHVGPSVLFAILVFVHSVQLWSGMRRHWESMVTSPAPGRGI